MQLQENQLDQPYTSTLSFLRKIDLIRLSLEFRLPTDGTVVNLRDRLRVYLNSHSETLYKNPRYRPLYPQHRRVTQPVVSQAQRAPITKSRSPSPASTVSTDSTVRSFDSWNGIDAAQPPHAPFIQPLQAPVADQGPVNYHPPPPPPPPSPSVPGSDPDFFPFDDLNGGPNVPDVPVVPRDNVPAPAQNAAQLADQLSLLRKRPARHLASSGLTQLTSFRRIYAKSSSKGGRPTFH